MNSKTDIFFLKYAKFEQEKYRESMEIMESMESMENIKSFEEIFTMYDDELKTSCTPYEAILIVDYKLNKRHNENNRIKKNQLYNFRVSYD